jgi:hypothetical protein
MRRIRYNSDADMRRLGRGDVEALARNLAARMRSGDLKPERVAMAAYLGHPAAQAMDLPPPPRVENRAAITSGPLGGFSEGSLAHAILDKGPISTKEATLFASDCAVRMLTRIYGSSSSPYYPPNREHFQLAVSVLEAARGWVLGEGAGDPVALAEELWAVSRDAGLSTDGNVLNACEIVGQGSRAQPSEGLAAGGGGIVRQCARAIRQGFYGDGATWREVPNDAEERAREAVYAEKQWQDAHLAFGLLADEWPLLPLPSFDPRRLRSAPARRMGPPRQ